MRDRKKRNIMIASLCCFLVFMGIGYALLTQILTINGTATLTGSWNIYIQSMSLRSKSATAESLKAEVDANDPTKASFDLTLLKPGDYVEYDVVVKNEGTVNAVLRKLEPTINSGNMDTLLTHTMIQGQILKAGETTEFTLKIRFDERATKLPQTDEERLTTYDIQLIYEQYDGDTSKIPEGIVPVTSNDCFEVDDNGVLINYDYSCGTYVTVPAVVDGITVTKISAAAFKEPNFVFYFENGSELPSIAKALNEESYQRLLLLVEAMGEVASGIKLYNYNEEISEDISNLYSQYGIVRDTLEVEADFTSIESKVEYLDLSQTSNLEKIEAYAFSSSSSTKTLKYLNLDGVAPNVLEEKAFNYSGIENLTIDANLHNTNMSGQKMGTVFVDTLRIFPSEETTELLGFSEFDPTNLILEEGITKIGDNVFSNKSIESIEMQTTLITIGNRTFSGNTKLSTIISEGNYSSQGNVTIPSTIEYIGEYAFRGCGFTEQLRVSNINTIGNGAFSNNSGITRLIVTDIENIGEYAFSDYDSNKNNINVLTLARIKNIGPHAFENNKIRSLSGIHFEEVETIGASAFAGNELGVGATAFEPKLITLCNIKSIGSAAFDGASMSIYTSNETVTYNGYSPTINGTKIPNTSISYYYDASRCG